MKILALMSLFFSFNLFAENFRVGKVDSELRIAQGKDGPVEYVEVIKDGKSIFKYTVSLVTQKLLQSGFVLFKEKEQPHLVTVWSSGAHGQEVIIFDLSKASASDPEEAVAYLYGSAWTIDLDINQERILIKGKGENNSEGIPEDQDLTFRP